MTDQNIKFIMARQDEAYNGRLLGKFFERMIPGVCKHLKIRCIHGDEIIYNKGRRIMCMVCGRALKGPLPIKCFFTGEFH